MTTSELLTLLDALHNATNPLTGEAVAATSCLNDTAVRSGINQLIRTLRDEDAVATTISEAEITTSCASLRELGYAPTVSQLAKVFIGSRSIVDPRLRGLASYRKYRGVLTRRAIAELLSLHRELIEGPKPARSRQDKPWRTVDFFDTDGFDKLSEAKATELYREVEALGLRKVTAKLPDYMVRARTHLPRSFEPWTQEERALLIEAMCYTNDGEKLASVFGRSESAIRQEGKRLIWNSQQRVA
ncbi:hypothetical protein LEM8419_00342 [Neolewinella maritima]|uniref:Uncharacterized protein n=1 Tax=Neolewinella maritima TaxID=1383882 RepID=A0ABM9AWG0_9BACT|nr:hypothetical protein [Neolewinella maritima]CAH0999047.1 hypothetical protein LEM8419_00342 [Neolewinella maritima]